MKWNVILIAMFISYGCSQSLSTDDSSSSDSSSSAAQSPYLGAISGEIIPKEGAPAESVQNAEVQIVGHPEYTTQTDSNGRFDIPNVSSGSYTALLSSELLTGSSLATQSTGADYGLKLDEIQVTTGEVSQVSGQLQKTGQLIGLIDFFENPNNLDLVGTDVYVPGTTFIAKTATNGSFSLPGLPPGTYSIYADHQGFATLKIDDVVISEDSTTDLGTRYMSLSLGPEGGLSVSGTDVVIGSLTKKVSGSRTVTITLQYDGEASLMKVSDESAFLNKSWEPVKTQLDWTFDSDGEKNLYVKFSDLNGLESSVSVASLIVDTEDPVLASTTLLHGWAQTANEKIFLETVGSDTGSGIKEIMISNSSSSFSSGETWQTFSSPINWDLVAGAGSKTVYLKVRDYLDRESNVVSDSINIGTHTTVFDTSYSGTFTLKKDQSPFQISGSSTTFESLTIEPGVTVELVSNLKVNGKLTAVGTSAEPIVIIDSDAVSSGPCQGITTSSLDMSAAVPGATNGTVFDEVEFNSIALSLNGGTIQNSTFTSTCSGTDASGSVTKTGFDNLTIDSNTFSQWYYAITVSEGDGNVVFSNNTGSVKSFVTQQSTADNSTVSNNNMTLLGGTAYSYAAGKTLSLSGNTVAGTCLTQHSISGSGNVTINDLQTTCTGGDIIDRNSLAGNLTVDGVTVTSCSIFLKASDNSDTTTVSNSNISGCNKFFEVGTGTYAINNNNISVSEQLVYKQYGSLGALTFTKNNITCNGSSGAPCDLLNHQIAGNEMGSFTMTNNNITMAANDSSRGFVLKNTVASTYAYSLTLNIDSNFWIGKSLNTTLTASGNIENQTHTSTAANATEVRLYHQQFSGGDITFTMSPATPYTYSVLGSAVSDAGPL